jgi:monoamine oxidase
MKRREFLTIGRVIPAGLLLWHLRRPRGVAAQSEQVLVIGAGIAGLAAARELRSNGRRVTVIEARTRLGGRTWTDTSLGDPVDLGASWIEGTRANPVADLARQFGLATVETGDALAAWGADGGRLSDDTLARYGAEFDELFEEVERLGRSLDRDISIGEGIRRALAGETLDAAERRALDWAMSALSTDSAADPDEMSLLYADDDEGFDGSDVIFPGGYRQLVDALARGLDVRLGHQVTRIEVARTEVRVTTTRGVLRGDRVLVTLPLGVLKSGAVAFSPPLPAQTREALDGLAMGVLNKTVMRFPRAYWPNLDSFAYLSDTPGEFPEIFNHHKATGRPILIAFAAGRFGREIEQRTDRQIQEQLAAILRKMFGTSSPAPSALVQTRWSRDPFARGSYAFVPVGGRAAHRRALSESVAGRLFFAGEATSAEHPGTVPGAFLSGLREAQRILEA